MAAPSEAMIGFASFNAFVLELRSIVDDIATRG